MQTTGAFTGFIAVITGLLYLYASALILKKILNPQSIAIHSQVIRTVSIAVLLHLYALHVFLYIDQEIFFDLGNAVSLVALLASIILLITHFKQPTETLGIFIYPFAAISALLPFASFNAQVMPIQLGSHVLLSVAAYSLMTLATAQAILYAVQEKRFKTKNLSGLLSALPPLQVMEHTLIQFISAGFILLTFALLSGLFFVEDMFEQHLIHKTFFAIVAWLVYGTFLIGRLQWGWRGQKATQYTIWAYVLLVLSYLGTSLVLEFII